LFVRGIELGTDVRLDAGDLGQVELEILRTLPKLASELAQFLGKTGSRIIRILALRFELLGDLVDPLRLLLRLLANGLGPGDCGILGVREQNERHEEEGCDDSRNGWVAGQSRPEEVRGGEPESVGCIRTLATHEAFCLLSVVQQGLVIDRVDRLVHWACSGWNGSCEGEGARDSITELSLRVDRDRRLTETRSGTSRDGDEGHQADHRNRNGERRQKLDGKQSGHREEADFRHGHRRCDEPRSPHDSTQPQAATVRTEIGSDGLKRGVQGAGEKGPRIYRNRHWPRRTRWRPPGEARQAQRRHQVDLRTGRRRKPGRQRRVGETS
jgi:hypothetical protein